DWVGLRSALNDLNDPDIAEILTDLPSDDEGVIFRLLSRDRAGAVFSYLPVEQQAELIASLSSEQMLELVNAMTPDDRVSLLDDLPAEVTRRILDSLSPQALAATRTLLGYPEGTAGHVMTPEYISLSPGMTVAEALDSIRRSERRVETLNVLYVVDAAGALLFDVRLGLLVRADPNALVGDLEQATLVSIPARTDLPEVVRLFKRYDTCSASSLLTMRLISPRRKTRRRNFDSVACKRWIRRTHALRSGNCCGSAEYGFPCCSLAKCSPPQQ
ncbi:magnesium transporter, partial [bacterium]|nr:magnesium transporter [bacterium]